MLAWRAARSLEAGARDGADVAEVSPQIAAGAARQYAALHLRALILQEHIVEIEAKKCLVKFVGAVQ